MGVNGGEPRSRERHIGPFTDLFGRNFNVPSAAGKPAADLGIEPIQPSDDHVQARGLFVRIVRPGEPRRHHVVRVDFHHEKIAIFVRAV